MKFNDKVSIQVQTALGFEMSLHPVQLNGVMPSTTPESWLKFLKSGGRRIPVSPRQIHAVQAFMRQHGTEALTPDGVTAFTVATNSLLECNPEQVEELSMEEAIA